MRTITTVYNIGNSFHLFRSQGDPLHGMVSLLHKQNYTMPNALKTIRMRAMTSNVWITLPLRGIPEYRDGPKYPRSHSMSRITMIQVSMRFLLYKMIWTYIHLTVNTPQPHPSAGECLSPPIGGEIKGLLWHQHIFR